MNQRHYTETIDGTDYTVANVGNPKGFGEGRSNVCCKCRLTFHEKDMVNFQGRWFGVPCDCYRDIRRLRNRDRV